MLKDGSFADLTIICGTKIWAVHKVILSAQSQFFKKACNGKFQVSTSTCHVKALSSVHVVSFKVQEATTGRIDLSDDYESAVEAMIQFFYTQQYSTPKPDQGAPITEATFQIEVQRLADKYDVPDLTAYATAQFESIIKNHWRDILSFADVIKATYASSINTACPLRKVLAEHAATHARTIFSMETDVDQAFAAAVATVPAYGVDVMVAAQKQVPAGEQRKKCKGCSCEISCASKITFCPLCRMPSYLEKIVLD